MSVLHRPCFVSQAAREFDDGFSELVLWIDATTAELGSQPPPNEDASILQEQIEEHKVRMYPNL